MAAEGIAVIMLVILELGVAFLASLVFVGLYVWRSRWKETPLGRHMVAFALALAVADGSLLAVSLGVPVPVWLFAAGFGLLDFVLIQRIILLVKIQEGE